jgi:hypothetical protein
MKVSFYLGPRNLTGQIRDYSASLWADLNEKEPLLNAIKEIYKQTDRVWTFNAMNKASDFPLIEKDTRKALETIHPEIQKAVARTVLNLLEAYRFRQIAMRNIDYEEAVACWRIRQLGETQFDGLEYFPQLEDCARNLDYNSMFYAGFKLLETGEQLADTLTTLKNDKTINWKLQYLNISTPMGRLVISGSKGDEHRYSDAFLVVDLAGNDTYYGAAGSTPSLDIPISLLIDMEGNDCYLNDDEFLPSQGSAIFGAAVLMDLSGNDRYESKRLSQGSAMLGFGVLADMEGDDEYRMWDSGQGGAYFGAGIAIDNSGDDEYFIYGDGQGYGGVGGVGSLLDCSGNDTYYAEPLASVVFRPDYHSKDGKLNYSYAQGCGIGRRGDITDGHSWAGGMGTLIDLQGDDNYTSANWSLGCGYWYGMGFLYDGAGNDVYNSASWAQSAGAHFCIGAFFDEGGNDKHISWAEQSVGMGFGHDYTIAIFLNRGGDDFYQLKDDGLGYAINMSQVFFFDTEGKDIYITGGKGRNYGWNNYMQNNPPVLGAFSHLYSSQICLFADLKDEDKYIIRDYQSGEESLETRIGDGLQYFVPTSAEKDTLFNKQYYGLGKDYSDYSGKEIWYFKDKMVKKFNH